MTRAVERTFGRRIGASTPHGRIRVATPLIRLPAGATSERLAGLDLLRLLAAFAVVAFHFGYAGPARGMMETGFPAISVVAKYGFLGVDLFFLISGYVICASAHGRTWREFAAARFLRLYPAHVVCMTATAVVLVLLGTRGAPVTGQAWLANLTMVAPLLGQPFMDGAYWSIVVEMVFYGWVGLLVALGWLEKRLLTILTVWLAVAAFNELFVQVRAVRLGLCTEYAALFASGMLIQRLRAGERSHHAFGLLGFAFGLGALHSLESQRVIAHIYGDGISLPLLLVLHAGIYAVFLGSLCASRWIKPGRLVLTIGALTYPLYLVHQQAGYALIDALSPHVGSWAALAVTTVAVICFAYAVQRWLEPAGRGIGRRALHRAFERPAAPRRLATRLSHTGVRP